ncbi:aspartate/glutamate racemase family protein [Kiloniella sp.]|uniref:aspartate/glutamate racemase family protein n=1 Tax=Kiloniella sp. TaxID=1938587 RepID=UPI003B026411
MLIVIYLLYVKLSETIHINRLLGGRHLFLLNKAEKSLENQEIAKPRLEKVGKQLRDEMGAKSVILGCAGMAAYRNWLQDTLDIPVIDPCRAAVSMAIGTMGTLRI